VAANRGTLESLIDAGAPIYGVTTGFGALVREAVPLDRSRDAQVNLLRSHAAGCGEPLPPEVVRAALVVRLTGLLRAHSGVRPVVLSRVADFLNAELTPVVPRCGSLGASGDLAPSAHAFLPLIGEGEVRAPDGRHLTGAEALSTLGLSPLELEAKEALALINGTHFMAGIGALLITRVARLLDSADATAALCLDALGGALPACEERVHRLRPLPGQLQSAANVSHFVRGSARVSHVSGDGAVQDAYSLRCVAQVHGAAREAATFFGRLVEVDLESVTDNPIIFDDPPAVVSAGNFHGQSLALAFDTLRIALADLGSISERRTFRLLSPSLRTGLPAFLSPQPGVSNGYMVAQYSAAALVAELRALAHPVSVDSIPTSDNQEDHVSMGMTAATMALEAIARVETELGIELVCACQALDLGGRKPGAASTAALELVRREIPKLEQDRPPAADIECATQLVRRGALAAVVAEQAAGAQAGVLA
jgi:histidine ammonia-lyase